MIKKIILALIGFTIIGFCVASLRVIDLGIDPLGSMCLGLTDNFGLSFGAFLVIVQLPLLALVFVKQKKLVGIGTIMGMFGIGYVVDFFFFLFTQAGIVDMAIPMPVRVVGIFIALLILCTGASIYMTADLGMIPYDSAGFVLEDMTKKRLQFRWIRLGMDGFCLVMALILGATVGIATGATVFLAGPLIGFIKPKVGSILEKKFLRGSF